MLFASFNLYSQSKNKSTQEIIYKAPSNARISNKYSMKVGEKDCPIYFTNTHNAHYAYFDKREGKTTISITSLIPEYWKYGVRINPSSKGIEAIVTDNKITFTVSEIGTYTVERADFKYIDKEEQVLVISINPPDENKYSPKNKNVIYYGPGFYSSKHIALESNQTLYVAGGAVLNIDGGISCNNVKNVRICGHGIINTSAIYDWQPAIQIANSVNISVDGVTVIPQGDMPSFILDISTSDSITINNYKAFGKRINNDGCTNSAVSNLKVTNCFIRSEDDCLAFYALQDAKSDLYDNKNILVSGCVFWPLMSGVCRIGSNTIYYPHSTQVHGLTIKDCDVLHMQDHTSWPYGFLLDMREYERPIGLSYEFENILFENIRMDRSDFFVNIHCEPSRSGKIRNLVFKDITINQKPTREICNDEEWISENNAPGFTYIGCNDLDKIVFQNIKINGILSKSIKDIGASLHGVVSSQQTRIEFRDSKGQLLNLSKFKI